MSFVERAHEEMDTWAKRILIAIAFTAALVVAWLLGAAFLPRWWAHRIGNQANGAFTGGILVGLFYGFVFTALPLVTLGFTFRRRRTWRTWGVMIGVAILLALPNLLTLGIVVGHGKAAHAGQRTLDVDAPGFRGAALGGAIAAALAVLLWGYLGYSRHRARDQVRSLRARLKAHEEAEKAPDDAS